MLIASVETRHANAGWRNYHFVKITTEDGVVGWSEYDEGFGSPGVTTIIETLGPRVVGADGRNHERVFWELYAATRPGSGGVVGQAIGAIENALLDAKAKTLGVPCHELLGGKIRDRVRVYWSHCGTYRIGMSAFYGNRISDRAGLVALGEEVRDTGFTALKTNLFTFTDRARSWAPGFNIPFAPDLNLDRTAIRGIVDTLEAFREGAGDDVDLLIDVNFNANTEGLLEIVRATADLDLFWIEIDTPNPAAQALVRRSSPHPISGLETLIGLHQFLPYFDEQAVDVAIIDGVWNGMWQAMKIAAAAQAHQVNVAPHNFYGHLSTFMCAHFSAAVPNLRIMETDIDRLPWDADLFTETPTFEDGHIIVPDTPGWGTEPDEAALEAHPPVEGPGFLVTSRSSS